MDEAEVEAIVGKAMRDGVVHYVVPCKGYGEGDDTEEPVESLLHCQELVDAYERENGDETMYEPDRIIKVVKRRGKVQKCDARGLGRTATVSNRRVTCRLGFLSSSGVIQVSLTFR